MNAISIYNADIQPNVKPNEQAIVQKTRSHESTRLFASSNFVQLVQASYHGLPGEQFPLSSQWAVRWHLILWTRRQWRRRWWRTWPWHHPVMTSPADVTRALCCSELGSCGWPAGQQFGTLQQPPGLLSEYRQHRRLKFALIRRYCTDDRYCNGGY